eukprot:GEMP01017368.1.p1 GENE.GEMP01017368.1~~GEMP01017368.1.p1  ORF type:complete len:669 (+),score=160.13 GEMP01017368.1:91-2097(+)
MKLSSYFLLSTLLALGNLAHAFITYEQFYPAVIHLSGDKLSRVILYNFAFVLFLGFSLFTLRFFLGTLRELEVEQLIDTGRGFLADTILFLVFYSPTVDGKEVDTVYLVQFICRIIFMKVFHLIVQIRVSHMFEVGLPRFWVNIKLFSLMLVLLVYDVITLKVYYPFSTRNSTFYAWIVFEALTMAVMLVATFFKYLIHIIDLRLEGGWPAKSAYLFYVDLIGDVANMTLFLIFMMACVFQNPSRLPVYMMADVLQVARQLAMRLKAFRKYRAITANMEQKFPNATPEELEKADSCIICRDTLHDGSKKLPCSHVFHLDCLKNWIVMQQCCPTCRAEIPANPTPPPPAAGGPQPVLAPQAPPGLGALAAPPPAAGAGAGAGAPAPAEPHQRTRQAGGGGTESSGATPNAGPVAPPAVPAAIPTRVKRVQSQLPPELENLFATQSSCALEGFTAPPQHPSEDIGMSVQDIVAGMKHAQKMAAYMRKQQDFWMQQVEALMVQAGDDPTAFLGAAPGEVPIFPARLNKTAPAKQHATPVDAPAKQTAPAEAGAKEVKPEVAAPKEASAQARVTVADEGKEPKADKEKDSKAEEVKVTVAKAAEGKDSKTAEGNDSKDAEGKDSKDAEAKDSKDAEGKDSKDAEGEDKEEELKKLREIQRNKWQAASSKGSM